MSASTHRSRHRAQQRRDRRRRQVRLIALFVGLLALVAAGFAVYLALSSPAPPVSVPEGSPVSSSQETLLLQVRAADGSTVAHAVVAHDATGATGGAVVLVPPQVLVNVPGTGSTTLGQALAASSPQGSRDALSDLMGVTIDQGWVLDEAALAGLVDLLGGVQVDVDVQVVGEQGVGLGPGAQLVDGARALALLRFLAEGEPEQARLARLQEVLDGIVTALPPTAAEVARVLGALGEGSVPTAALPDLSDLLVGLAADDDDGRLQYDVLPVVDLDAGGATTFRADVPAMNALVDRLLAASVPPGVREGGNRVLVLNGVGTPGLGDAVRARLVPAGFVFVDARNADRFGYESTQVLVPAATQEAQALGERVAAALGLPDALVATQDFGTVADVVVLVGADFRP